MPDQSEPQQNFNKFIRKRDYYISIFFILFWLLPISYVGLFKKPVGFMPNYFNNLYRCACLFTKAMKSWSNYYFQVRLQGRKNWINVAESDYSRLKPFGYRTRFKRILGKSNRASGIKTRQAMAEFVKQRYEDLHPKQPFVESVRFIRTTYRVGEDQLAKPRGHWKIPPLDEVPKKRQTIVSTHFFDESR